jgi:peptide/nickel transport system substrate-binding protein
MAFGLTTASTDPQSGAGGAVAIVVGETLITFGKDGRPQARLAENWTVSADGRTVKIALRRGALFHDGSPVTATAVSDLLKRPLSQNLGPAYDDIEDIRASSDIDVEFVLKRRSPFVLEALHDVAIRREELPGGASNGTGPFKVTRLTAEGAEIVANERYYGGKPAIDRILIKPYESVRAAWADMLRGQVDMLYEVGTDAIDVLQPSTAVKLITHQRNYVYGIILNVQRSSLRDREFRQALNAAIDRQALVSDILKGHGTPAVSAMWTGHWAYDPTAPKFDYQPKTIDGRNHQFTCLVSDASQERLALAVQKQLHAVGVDMKLDMVPLKELTQRLAAGDFDAVLADLQVGPSLVQQYRFWHPGNTRNWGRFDSAPVNTAFDEIRDSATDEEYRHGVAAFQRAIFDDPPAIFLAWSERARAISTRFDVPAEPGRDILGTVRLWRPLSMPQIARRN